MALIHNSKLRMPVIIPEGMERKWLDRDLTKDEVMEICRPAPEEFLEDHPVSRLITSRGSQTNVPEVWAKHDYPELRSDRTDPAISSGTLF